MNSEEVVKDYSPTVKVTKQDESQTVKNTELDEVNKDVSPTVRISVKEETKETPTMINKGNASSGGNASYPKLPFDKDKDVTTMKDLTTI